MIIEKFAVVTEKETNLKCLMVEKDNPEKTILILISIEIFFLHIKKYLEDHKHAGLINMMA